MVGSNAVAVIVVALVIAGVAVAYSIGYLAVTEGNYISRYLDLGDDFIYAIAMRSDNLIIVIQLDRINGWCYGAIVPNHRAVLYVNGERVGWRTVDCIEPYYTFIRHYRMMFPSNDTRVALIEGFDVSKYGDGIYEVSVTYVYGNVETEKLRITLEVRDGKIYAGGLTLDIPGQTIEISDWLVIKSPEVPTATEPLETSTTAQQATTTTSIPQTSTSTTPPPPAEKSIIDRIVEFFRSIVEWFKSFLP